MTYLEPNLPSIVSLRSLMLALAAAVGLASACSERAATGPEALRTGEACELRGQSMACGDDAFMYCDSMADAQDLQWGPCFTAQERECVPGEVEACEFGGELRCELFGGAPTVVDNCEADQGGDTPLVLRFDDAPVNLIPMGVDGFDISGRGECDAIDWPAAETPWLAMDRDLSGAIESGAELFGSGTRLRDGRRARNGFEALAEFDSDGDGAITPLDARWGELRTWADYDGDRAGVGYEVGRLDDSGLVRIELGYRIDRMCDARGNCEVERADFVFRDQRGELQRGEVIDLHLACQ